MKANAFGAVIIFLIAFISPYSNGLLRKNAEPSYPPTFVVTPPLLVYAKPDEPLILPCHVDAMPVPNYQWLVDGREANWIKPFYHVTSIASTGRSIGLPYASNNHTRSGDKLGAQSNAEHTRWYLGQIGVTVEFKPGVYQCTAWNAFGRVISSPVQVRFARLGMIKEHQEQTVTIRSEEPIRLNCSVTSSEPTATIRWMMRAEDGSVEFVRENRTSATDDDGNLYLLERTTRKHQVFVCAVNNPVLRTIKTGPDVHVYSVDRVKDQQLPPVRHRPRLVYHSNREPIALVNHSLTLRCLITGYPLPEVNWQWAEGEYNSRTNTVWNDVGVYRDVDQLPKSFGVHVRHDGTQLFIPSVKLHNAGTYRCVAKVQRHTEMDTTIPMISFKVTIEGEPTFSREPENTIVPVFGTAVMQCAVDEEATQPPAQVMWLLNGGSIDQYLDGHRKLRRFDDLYIHNATVDDIAVFQCQISNVHGRRVSNAYLHVWQQPPSILQFIPEEKCVAEDSTITLPCRTMGAPKANIQWLRNGMNIRPSAQWMGEPQQKYYVTTDGDLQIKHISMGDSGKYTCIASNKYGDSQATGRLTVRKRTRIVSGPRMVLGHADRTTNRGHGIIESGAMNHSGDRVEQVIENTSVWLRCDVSTDPMEISHLRMVWKKDDETLNVDALKSSGRLGLSADGTALNIVGIKPSDTGVYTCSAHSRLDSDNASVYLIVQGKPGAPRQLTLTCSSASALSPFARLQWQLGPYNNPPVDHAVIEFVAGTYRPLAPTLTHYRRDFDRQSGQVTSLHHPSGNASVAQQSLKAIWMQETVSRARQLAKKLIFTNRWSRIQPVASKIVENHVASQHPSRGDINPAILSPSTDMEQAFVRLHADVFYHFRVRLVNRIGQSEPSFIVPELDSQSICHLPPEPVSTVPSELFVYGTHPHNLRIRWPPLPPIEHNGPGLIYRLTITCLDCQLGPIKPLTNLTVVTDWSVGELELEQLTTRELVGREQYERVRHWQVETFRTYEVNLTTENMFGSTVAHPMVQTGQSGEGIPTVFLEPPRPIFVGSQNATLLWRRLTQMELDQKILGYFRGFRVEWCEAQLTEELCNFYKAHQDYVVKVPPVWSVPELRTSGLSRANHEGKLADEVNSRRAENKDEPSSDSLRNSRTASDSNTRSAETNSSIAYINGSYVAQLKGLPGKTRIKAWLRVLNIQFAGPPSDTVIFVTNEGVPEAVPEIVATFVGVTHVELSWVKPLKTNGDLIAYDLEITQVPEIQYSKMHTDNSVRKINRESESSSQKSPSTKVKSKTIKDPEQLATRISGLRMDTEYDITIWPRTKAGRGQKSDLRIRTAQLTRNAETSPFLVHSVPTSPNSVNICLTHPLKFPGSRPSISDNKGIRETTESRRMNVMASVDPEAIHGPWQNEQVFTPSNQVRSGADWSNSPSPSSASPHFPKVESDMFYAQFRTVGDEYWEETQREFQKPWIVLSNLKPNHEYEIRVVIVTASGESTVSQSKIIHVPTPPESWFTGASLFTRFTGFQNSTVFIGSACTFILLLSSVVATVFLACWCRRRHNRHQHLRQRSCPDNSLRHGEQPGSFVTTGRMYNTLKDSGHNTSTLNNGGNATSTLSVRPTTMDLSLTTSYHTTEPLLPDSNIPDAFKPDPNCCVWVDRVTDPCATELNTYNPESLNRLQLGPDLTRSLMRKHPENVGLLTCSHIPLTDVGRPAANGESTLQSFTSRTFNL